MAWRLWAITLFHLAQWHAVSLQGQYEGICRIRFLSCLWGGWPCTLTMKVKESVAASCGRPELQTKPSRLVRSCAMPSTEAKAFYLHHGFVQSPIEDLTVMINLSDVAAKLPAPP